MNALPSPRPSVQPLRPQRRVPTQSSQQRHRRHIKALALEAVTKLAVNLVVCTVAIGTLAQLLPRISGQQAKLKEVRAEVKAAQWHADRVQEDFNRYFDPRQAEAIIREQTDLIDPKQRTVVFSQPPKVLPGTTSAELPTD
jgi:cell division protein FtsB